MDELLGHIIKIVFIIFIAIIILYVVGLIASLLGMIAGAGGLAWGGGTAIINYSKSLKENVIDSNKNKLKPVK